MIDFATTTAFRLVRRLAMGQGSAAMYLLIREEGTEAAVEADLQAEVEVQLSSALPIRQDIRELLGPVDTGGIRALRIDRWAPALVALLDTHVIRLEQTGAQFLFLTTSALAEQLLAAAPNFRNRLTEVLRIVLDDPSEGVPN